MMGLITALHVMICILLIIIILIQAGRGGGLVEGFSGVESMFGPKTNTFLTRTTTVLAILFFLTCLSLAFFSARQSRSLMAGVKAQEPPKQAQQEPSGEVNPTPPPITTAQQAPTQAEPVKQETPVTPGVPKTE